MGNKPRGLVKWGKRKIDFFKMGSWGEHKIRERMIYKMRGFKGIYWFQMYRGHWVNTTLKGVRNGIAVHPEEWKKIP